MPGGNVTIEERLRRIEGYLCRMAQCICQPQGLRTYNIPWSAPAAGLEPPSDVYFGGWCVFPSGAFIEVAPADMDRLYIAFVCVAEPGEVCVSYRGASADCDYPLNNRNSPLVFSWDRDGLFTRLQWFSKGTAGVDVHILRRGGPQQELDYFLGFMGGQL